LSDTPLGFHHLAIQVRDLAVVERFYAGTLGLPVLKRWMVENTETERSAASRGASGGDRGAEAPRQIVRSVWLDAGDGAFLALERVAGGTTAREDATRADRPGLHLIALRITRASRADWEQRLAAAGFPVESRTSFTLYVRDPEGNRVGLSHWPDAADMTS
jgi:catechol 2,3-dioxygenase-like lactoylglutathione lyase family enzyme